MKLSLLKNDKSTYFDEIVLFLMVLVSLIVGILLIVYRPEFLFISSNGTVMFGVLITLFGVMFIPGLIYRLFTNEC